MKKILVCTLGLLLMLCLVGCGEKSNNDTYTFKAKVVESYANSIIVEPLEDEEVRKSAN